MLVAGFMLAALALGVVAATLDDRSPLASRVAKMAASSLILVVAVVGNVGGTYAVLVVVALAFSWIGDLALSFSAERSFLIGLISFAVGHVFYVIAFVVRGSLSLPWAVAGLVLMLVVGVSVLKWLEPHRPDEMRIPLIAYVAIIGAMVTFGFATHGGDADWRIPAAAVAFAASDILVARHQFVIQSPVNRIVGLPLYFFAQALFALTVV